MPDIEDYRAGRTAVPTEMLAWQLTGKGLDNLGEDGRPERIAVPRPGPGELLCRIDAAGLCFSDIKVLTLGSEHPRISGRDLQKNPVIMGHEVSLTVVQVGQDLQDEYHLGDRFVVQADIYYKGQGLAFGYALNGALEQFAIVGKEILQGDDGRYIIPVKPNTGYAEAALSEPWACVERSYRASHRPGFASGGEAFIAAAPGGDYSAVTFGKLAQEPWPAKVVINRPLPENLRAPIEAAVGAESIEEVACPMCATADGRQYDDIVLIGDFDPEHVEACGNALKSGGILCLIRSTRLPRRVDVDVGRIHYDDTHYLGAPGPDIAAGYVSRDSDIKPEGTAWYIGAGGPMGQMHVQRAAEDPKGPSLALATDVDNERLGTIPERYGDAAEQTGMQLVCLNPTEMSPDEFRTRARELAPEGFDDIVCLAPVPALVSDAMDYLGANGVLNIFAGLARGTVATLDLSPVYLKGARLTGTSGSAISDFEFTLHKTETGELSPNRSVAAIGGMAAAHDGLRAVKEGTFAGKVVIYPQIPDLPLTPLEDLKDVLPDVAAKLGPKDTWTNEAELALLEHVPDA
jgi:threonine dehydrogenase-like Zn-dependent dehydrogenase